jgi:hypothetical protein
MRRVERAAILVGATAITPLVALLEPSAQELPILLALGSIAVFANASAIQRLAAIRSLVRERSAVSPLPTTDEASKRAAE